MEQGEIKTFRDLQEEVILKGLCGKCGGCVSFCSAGTLNALEMGGDDLPRYADKEKCLACGICYMICPSTVELDAEVQDKFGWRPPIGTYETVRSARVTDEAIHEVATDGGVVTALLLYMLDNHLIDGAIVSRKTSIFGREPLIATTREELIAAAGSYFGGSSHLEELGDQYTTYSPTISAVKGLESQRLQRVAMVGTPCQVRTIKKMQCLGILPAHIITHIIGLFCIENFVFNELSRKKLEDKLHIHFEDITKLNIKEDVIVSLKDGTTVHVPFEEVDEMARPACLACTDFANDYADLSAGGLGSPAGYTTILIRTQKGKRVYGEALSRGYIGEIRAGSWAKLRSEETRMIDQVIAFAQTKRTRGEVRLRELGIEGGVSGE
jgi:coenzyme F420 hydrogenase subunit beta